MTCCETEQTACRTGEELFGGLCYMTCAALTSGKSPHRTSAFTCCADDCGLTNQEHDLGMCSGFSVSGDGKSCPHPPATCVTQSGFCKGFSVSRDGKSCP